jgi:3-oxoacyl-(acyl-carrier-protein) synthase
LKRALATSKEALKDAHQETVDAIITGTGYGCIENTELFLDALSKEGEQLLKPTYFMQSTHNTISSLVAIQTKNHGYNVTYAHKGISFDSALQDAWLQFRLGKIDSALVGGHDEMTETFYHILKKGGVMGHDDEMCGEASISVVFSRHCDEERRSNPDYLCKLIGFEMLHQPSKNALKDAVDKILQSAGKNLGDVDYILTGMSGNHESDRAYREETKTLFGDKPLLKYKHLFGESFTASGLGFYVAAQCLKAGQVPASLFVNKDEACNKRPNCILLYNRSDEKNVSLTLLEAESCGN